MFRGWDPTRPDHRYWFTPGGGLDGDEPPAVAAARELAEETGLRITPEAFGEPVWRDVTEFSFDGRWYRQVQDFFLVRVPEWEVDTAGFNDLERRCIDTYRWWTVEELERTGERFYPVELPALLRRLLAGEAC
jgi:8-oxo-dGTP pyrophosphatase MutT (NUDIX family)